MKDRTEGPTPVTVLGGQSQIKEPGAAKHELRRAKPSGWTTRMLAALKRGITGGKWHSLIDKVYAMPTLKAAYEAVFANKGAAGVDHVTPEHYGKDLDANLNRLQDQLRNDEYRPQAIRRQEIPKPGSQETRPLGIPTVQDRVVQTALRMILEPIFEQGFAPQSYGFRPNRGCKDALRRVDRLLKAGYVYVVDADLKSYFDTIPKDRLLALVAEKVADNRILALVEAYLNQSVKKGTQEWVPEQGTPQGAVISPLLSNIYLNPLDHLMAGKGYEMIRYADDFVVLCRTSQEAAAALAEVQKWTANAGLTLHPQKTRTVHAKNEGFDFLGYHFERGRRWPRKKSMEKLKDGVRKKTRRTVGCSLTSVIEDLNPMLKGWFEYFKHSYKWTFPMVDGWVRRRLRSILRKQKRIRGISKVHGADHRRWPNAYFIQHGLFSLQNAYAQIRQPP